ncbi:MAG: FAD-binding oxidoreductase [Chitinophagaceae bacterium]
MPDVKINSIDGREIVIAETNVNDFKSGLLGSLLRAGDQGYEAARTLWNGMIDLRPSLIARCTGAADVISCVKFARKNNLLVSVKGAGHNIAGKGSSNGSFMIDLSLMNSVSVDPDAKTALVGPGATLRMLDHETQAFGLATPVGINSTTGISGLTLGGGFGWLSRSLGLTVDNLLSADIVTADGKLLHANEKENPDIFWAIRGGGGNFGIVTSFKFRLHPIGPMLLAGLIVHPFSETKRIFRYYRDFVAKAPDQLTCWVVLRKAPPLPFLPAEVHGKEIFIIAVVYAGDMQEGEKILDPLRKFGKPIADVVGPTPFAGFQQAFDPLLTPGARNYWKSHNFTALTDEAIDTITEYAGKLPSPLSEIFMGNLGGAVNRVAVNATAYPHRDPNFVMNIHTRWEDKESDATCIDWARELFGATSQFATGGVYVNFISEGEELVPSAFGANYQPLAEIKKKFDPDNFFRINQNIKPAQ